MAYDFRTPAFVDLALALRDHPRGVPERGDQLRDLARLYLSAADALFRLMFLILLARIAATPRGGRFEGFLPIYEDRVRALFGELEPFLLGDDVAAIRDFLEGVRQSALAEEMVALQNAVGASTGEGRDLDADAEATATVTNSLKEQIARRVKNPWIQDILHAINEIVGVVRGVV